MANDSATGGYLVPTTPGLPGGVSLNQFIQTVLVGISGLPGILVRPRWQVAPPVNPDLSVNWLAFGISTVDPDANAWIGPNVSGNETLQRHEGLEIKCAFYGPDAMNLASLVRDGFQVQQNLEALRAAKMGFAFTNLSGHIPDLVNERWIDRVEMSVFLRREIERVYPVLAIQSAEGTVETVLGDDDYSLPWETQEEI